MSHAVWPSFKAWPLGDIIHDHERPPSGPQAWQIGPGFGYHWHHTFGTPTEAAAAVLGGHSFQVRQCPKSSSYYYNIVSIDSNAPRLTSGLAAKIRVVPSLKKAGRSDISVATSASFGTRAQARSISAVVPPASRE